MRRLNLKIVLPLIGIFLSGMGTSFSQKTATKTKLQGSLKIGEKLKESQNAVYVTLDQPCDFYIDDFTIE